MVPKVSVIIPVYKVEQYIRMCLESVLNQTLREIEVILVDDGSPDNCPQICDEYKKVDKRVKVIHQENQGSSVARNSGINCAIGEYIAFVDSDDVISSIMLETLYSVSQNADIVECEVCKKQEELWHSSDKISTKVVKTNILASYLYANKVGVWCRIYKRSLIQGLPFEADAFSEDVMWSYHVFCRCNSYVKVNAILYYWRQNEDSLSKSCIKHFKSQGERLAEIIRLEHPDVYPIMENHLIVIRINLLSNAVKYGFANKEVEQEFLKKRKPQAIQAVRNKIWRILFSKFFRMQTKIKAVLILLNFNLFKRIIRWQHN